MDRIEINPAICGGMPVIRGTRIPIAVIRDCIETGDSIDDILQDYPELSHGDIQAAIDFLEEKPGE